MKETIFTVIGLAVGILILGAGLYYHIIEIKYIKKLFAFYFNRI